MTYLLPFDHFNVYLNRFSQLEDGSNNIYLKHKMTVRYISV